MLLPPCLDGALVGAHVGVMAAARGGRHLGYHNLSLCIYPLFRWFLMHWLVLRVVAAILVTIIFLHAFIPLFRWFLMHCLVYCTCGDNDCRSGGRHLDYHYLSLCIYPLFRWFLMHWSVLHVVVMAAAQVAAILVTIIIPHAFTPCLDGF
jgi:hypothetical protein